jgi:hypothetical protein
MDARSVQNITIMPNMIENLPAVDEESAKADDDKGALSFGESIPEPSCSSATGSESSTTGGVSSSLEEEPRSRIVKEEENNLRKARILVGNVFVACSVAVTIAVYFFAKKSDERSFEIEVSRNIVSA